MSARLIILLNNTQTHFTLPSQENLGDVQSIPHEEFSSWIQDVAQQDIRRVVVCAEPDVLYTENSRIHAIKEAFVGAGSKVHTLHLAQALAYQYLADKANVISQNMIVLYAGDSLLFSLISGGRVIRGQHQVAGNLGESLLKNPGLEGNTFQSEPLKNFVSSKGVLRVAGGIMAIFCQGAGLHETFTFANSGYSI
ncbi:MAG: hypothetical protein AAGC85_12875, partial [Bacteroidota bacterium]